jgi:hypothetical protein
MLSRLSTRLRQHWDVYAVSDFRASNSSWKSDGSAFAALHVRPDRKAFTNTDADTKQPLLAAGRVFVSHKASPDCQIPALSEGQTIADGSSNRCIGTGPMLGMASIRWHAYALWQSVRLTAPSNP